MLRAGRFVESYSDPATDPVVLWLNGGPGCSSLDGFLYEHGPFRINETDPTKLVPFEWTWARNANMLYLEAPVGVGFSYSDDPSADYKCNDDTAAEDNLHAVESFFKKFPELSKNSLFITGESSVSWPDLVAAEARRLFTTWVQCLPHAHIV